MNDTTENDPAPEPDPSQGAASAPFGDAADTTGEGAGGEPTADASTAPPPPTSAPPAAPPPRRLVRSESERMIGGVAGGLAQYLGLDPVLVRVGFVLLAIFGGTGVLLYFIGWLVIPSASTPVGAPRRFPAWLSIVVGVVGFLIVANVLSNILFTQHNGDGSPVFWALALVALGVLLFRQDTRMAHAGATAPAVPAAGPAAPAPPSAAGSAGYEAWTPPPPRPPKPRSILGRVTIAITLVALGVAAMLDNVGAVVMGPSQFFALALTGIGLGLLVGGWRGRAYWLIVIGALLVPPTFATNFVSSQNINLQGGLGERYYQFESIGEIDDEYHLGAGLMQLDFVHVPFTEPVDVEVSMGAGELIVVVPDDARVQVEGTIRAGDVTLFGDSRGYDPGQLNSFSARVDGDESQSLLSLDLAMGLGEVTVVQEGGALGSGFPDLRSGPFLRGQAPLPNRGEPLFNLESQEL